MGEIKTEVRSGGEAQSTVGIIFRSGIRERRSRVSSFVENDHRCEGGRPDLGVQVSLSEYHQCLERVVRKHSMRRSH